MAVGRPFKFSPIPIPCPFVSFFLLFFLFFFFLPPILTYSAVRRKCYASRGITVAPFRKNLPSTLTRRVFGVLLPWHVHTRNPFPLTVHAKQFSICARHALPRPCKKRSRLISRERRALSRLLSPRETASRVRRA